MTGNPTPFPLYTRNIGTRNVIDIRKTENYESQRTIGQTDTLTLNRLARGETTNDTGLERSTL